MWTKHHFRHYSLFAFNRGVKFTEVACDICTVYEDGAMTQTSAHRWFSRFKKTSEFWVTQR